LASCRLVVRRSTTAAERYHKRAAAHQPNADLHAMIDRIIEAQRALGK